MLREVLEETKQMLEKDGYKEFFNKKLKKYGVKSPSELKGAEKKKFFDEVENGWTAEDEKE